MSSDLRVDQGAARVRPGGDWATVDGTLQNLQRRLSTPIGSLWYDPTYGNRAYSRLSQPATGTWLQNIAEDCRQAAASEPGVVVNDSTAVPDGRKVTVTLFVTISGAPETLILTLQGV